jgi:glycerol-3-phosphate acyltransferase PlsY
MILSYLIGSIPFSLILGKIFKHIDLRKMGSGNLGATNAYRIMGLKYGILTFFFDVLKSEVVILLLVYVIKNQDYYIFSGFNGISIYGVCAVIGHCYSIFIKFKGGKAVASGFGVALTISLFASLISLAMFLIVFSIKKIVSLSSLIGTITIFIVSFIDLIFIQKLDLYHYIITIFSLILIVVLIIFRHSDNIERIINNTESALY